MLPFNLVVFGFSLVILCLELEREESQQHSSDLHFRWRTVKLAITAVLSSVCLFRSSFSPSKSSPSFFLFYRLKYTPSYSTVNQFLLGRKTVFPPINTTPALHTGALLEANANAPPLPRRHNLLIVFPPSPPASRPCTEFLMEQRKKKKSLILAGKPASSAHAEGSLEAKQGEAAKNRPCSSRRDMAAEAA